MHCRGGHEWEWRDFQHMVDRGILVPMTGEEVECLKGKRSRQTAI